MWQTAINPVIALELLAAGTWSGAGVLGPEAFDAVPFLDLLTAYGSPWGLEERTPTVDRGACASGDVAGRAVQPDPPGRGAALQLVDLVPQPAPGVARRAMRSRR